MEQIKTTIIVLMCFGLTLLSCGNKNDKRESIVNTAVSVSDTVPSVAERLRILKSEGNCIHFITLFPNSFKEFVEIYGYKGDTFSENYNVSYDHINFYFDCNQEDDSDLKYKKAFSIAFDGSWQADAVNFFQRRLVESILDEPEILISFSVNLDSVKQYSFYHFLLDGPVPNDKVKKNHYEQLNQILAGNKTQQEILEKAYMFLLSDKGK